ncbi:MAG: hypothetical protein HOM19_02825, partial [Candidatus Marinimicrobia bacterium]|nr:hypothetical protein [Candidatus Neomarinimicrobiota bacterium]MBT6517815.1 hypothetical protein [Candidatus Neomarinimicrobiota bacterium]
MWNKFVDSQIVNSNFHCYPIDSALEGWQKIVIGALLTTIVWIAATYFTPPDDEDTLRAFVKKVNPGG